MRTLFSNSLIRFSTVATVAALLVVAFAAFRHSRETQRRASLNDLPRVTVWAWERREDLRTLDAQNFGIAYLDQTITVADRVSSKPRMQPLLVAEGAKLISVVRIEAPPRPNPLDDADVKQVAELVLRSASKPNITALQIDFDATQSQRKFYAALLSEVRLRMPREMPLSITALASWCAHDDWISSLPIDEAVPMFFRMGEKFSTKQPGWEYPLREPLCMTSAGVSNDEPWPKLNPQNRLYVFHPSAWNEIAFQNLRQELTR